MFLYDGMMQHIYRRNMAQSSVCSEIYTFDWFLKIQCCKINICNRQVSLEA